MSAEFDWETFCHEYGHFKGYGLTDDKVAEYLGIKSETLQKRIRLAHKLGIDLSVLADDYWAAS